MKKLIPLLTLFTAVLSASSVHAACTNPAGEAATTFYNTTVNAVQFCDGDDWYNTGLVAPSATGTNCTTPAGEEGTAFYNTTQNTIQFCNGDDWVNMGTMRFPSATGTMCAAPAGEEGTMFFNTTTKTMQFCNGDNWVNATYLSVAGVHKLQASDVKSNSIFGYSVSISGDYAIVGAHGDDTDGANTGSAYIFKRSGNSWVQQQKIQASDKQGGNAFGVAVSIHGDRVVVGAMNEATGGSRAGAAYIFKRTGTIWSQEAKIKASDPAVNNYFGWSVSIDGDSIIVGAYGQNTSRGAAYIFKRSGSTWTQEAKLLASNPNQVDLFGYSVSISGDYAIAGAYGVDSGFSSAGSAYIFKRTGNVWAQQAQIQAADRSASASFGFSVSIDGDSLLVGAIYEDSGGSNAGAAYVFKRSGVSWIQEAKITASDPEVDDYFGHAVSIEGDQAVVAAPQEDTGGSRAGAAYVFKRSGTTWTEESKIQASDKETLDTFGLSVAINNGKIIVGAPFEDTGGSSAGAAYIFD